MYNLKKLLSFSICILTNTFFLSAQSLDGLTRYEILQRYAPVFHHEVIQGDLYDGQDLIVGVDHDYNWGTFDDDDDVWASDSHWPRTTLAMSIEEARKSPNHNITPVVYASFQELKDFYLCKYAVYHTYNELVGAAGDHLNDVEVVEVLVTKGGTISGALTSIHSTTGWATPWASDDNMVATDTYSNATYTLHLWDKTHPIVWIKGNSDLLFDLNKKDYGHAIFPQNEWNDLNGPGISYYPKKNLKEPQAATKIGTFVSNWSYSSEASYQLVPLEELLIKGQMGTAVGKMYQVGQSMGTWGGRFWGNGWWTSPDVGGTTDADDIRYRYNDSYSGPDMNTTKIYDVRNGVGITNTDFTTETYRDLGKGITDISSFHRNRYANIIGSGCFNKNGGDDLLFFKKLNKEILKQGSKISAKVKRVGGLHLTKNWFSNPFKVNYINGTGPTGGIMLRASDNPKANFIYIGIAPEKNKLVFITRNNGSLKVVYDNANTRSWLYDYPLFIQIGENGKISVGIEKDIKWEVSIKDFGFDKDTFAALVTQSDVDSQENYYWTNAEYSDINYTVTSPKTSRKNGGNKEIDILKKEKLSLSPEHSFKLYPNPATDKVILEWQATEKVNKTSIVVYDMLSNKVMEKKIQIQKGKNSQELTTSSMSPGIYTIKINEQMLQEKLLIE
ncbi:T9SS type A sorting domain-containing protein [Tenacibaculum sp. 190524A02b]|uniref:T9SS type A sorting domain-containing protein n=1 Tax=Tenacibaculum vairaonense TaxID=3137860 RepID=UPI0031FB7C71